MKNLVTLILLVSLLAAETFEVSKDKITIRLIKPGTSEELWSSELEIPESGKLKPILPDFSSEYCFLEIETSTGIKVIPIRSLDDIPSLMRTVPDASGEIMESEAIGLTFGDRSGTENIRLFGNLGIGLPDAVDPASKLDIRDSEVLIWDGIASRDYVDGSGDLYVEDVLELDGELHFSATSQLGIDGYTGVEGEYLTVNSSGNLEWGEIGTASDIWTNSGSDIFPNDLGWNVGIGTNTPADMLHVMNGNARFSPSAAPLWSSPPYMQVTTDPTHSYALQLKLWDGNTANPRITLGTGAGTATFETTGNISLNTDITGSIYRLRTNNDSSALTDRLTISGREDLATIAMLNSNVGINTTSAPDAKLVILENTESTGLLLEADPPSSEGMRQSPKLSFRDSYVFGTYPGTHTTNLYTYSTCPGCNRHFLIDNQLTKFDMNSSSVEFELEADIQNWPNLDIRFIGPRVTSGYGNGTDVVLDLQGQYWNGSSSAIRSAKIVHEVEDDGSSTMNFQVQSSTDKMTITSLGNVGINTSIPSNRFEVSGEASYENASDMGTDDADFASKFYVDNAVTGSGDGDWAEETTPADFIRAKDGGIASYDATLFGTDALTHINLGYGTSVTGTSGSDFSYITLSGGFDNQATASYSTIAGGWENQANEALATVGGGRGNIASGQATTIAGGALSNAESQYATIGGGYGHNVSSAATNGTIAGGYLNTSSDIGATIGGGRENTASAWYATIPGGYQNEVSGRYSAIAGGRIDSVGGDYSFAFGQRAIVSEAQDYSAVFNWHDYDGTVFIETNALSTTAELYVNGDTRITGQLRDSSGDSGALGQVLSSTTSGTDWITDADSEIGNEDVTGLSFNTATGDLTLTQDHGGTIIENLDGRYATSASGLTGSGSATQIAFWSGASSLSGDSDLYWDNASSELGIGTSDPETPLHIYKSGTGIQDLITLDNDGSSAGTAIKFVNDDLVVQGRIKMSPSTVIWDSRMDFDVSWGTGMGDNTFTALSILGRVSPGGPWGYVGIGTTSPSYKLEVNGSMQADNIRSGTFDLPTSDGSSGQFLSYNGTWATPSGGSSWSLSGNSGTTAGTNFMGTTDDEDIVFKTNSAEVVRINTDGEVAIGNFDNPEAMLEIRETIADINVRSYNDYTWQNGSKLVLQRMGGSKTSPTATQANYGLGVIDFRGGYGPSVSGVTSASITSVSPVTWNGASYTRGGDLRFFTTNLVGSANVYDYERMRIGSEGKVGININPTPSTSTNYDPDAFAHIYGGIGLGPVNNSISPAHGEQNSIQIDSDTYYGGLNDNHSGYLIYSIMPGSWGTGELRFACATDWGVYNTSTPALRITQSGIYANGTYYSSDSRIKADLETIPYGIEQVMSMEPLLYQKHTPTRTETDNIVFNNNSDENSQAEIGLIAQDLYNIIPEVVSKPNDENSELWAIDYAKIVPVLIKGMQEQQAEIEQLKIEIEKLKNDRE